jgi:hypothetical protein
MSTDHPTSPRVRRIALLATLAVVLVPFAYSVVSAALAGENDRPDPFLETPDGECVRPTRWMRFHHMDLLKELRDEELRRGAEREISFDKCRECHPSRERFCNRCHDEVNLVPDCFGCHYYEEPTGPEEARR